MGCDTDEHKEEHRIGRDLQVEIRKAVKEDRKDCPIDARRIVVRSTD